MGLSDDAGLREAILEASLELGCELGAEGLTMRAIARRLNVSATALYQHFDSKTAILRAIRLRGLKAMTEFLRPAYALESPVDQVSRECELYLRFAIENPWLYCVLLVEDPEDWSSLEQSEVETVSAMRAESRKALVAGQSQGLFRADLDIERTASTQWAALHGLALLILRGRLPEPHHGSPPEVLEPMIKRFVADLTRSLLASPELAAPTR